MNQTAALEQHAYGTAHDIEYQQFLERLNARFLENVGNGVPLFTTSAKGLFDTYLSAFPEETRQHHNCNACHHFIKKFGGLVMLREDGTMAPAFWNEDDAPEIYRESVRRMILSVRQSYVTGVFLSSEAAWGTPLTGEWQHLSVTPPPGMVFSDPLHTARQVMAAKREDFNTLSRAVSDYTLPQVGQALFILNSDALFRSEKVLAPVNWLNDLMLARDGAKHIGGKARRDNVTWLAVAGAPAGFCTPRSTMTGTLLDDIAAGLDFPSIAARFKSKMDVLKYQRPQAAPAAGAIAQAEKIMAKLGAAGSLARRFARLDELKHHWRPLPASLKSIPASVFGHLTPKDSKNNVRKLALPNVNITWERFSRTVLPGAVSMELMAPPLGSYAAIVTAENADAPPIIQWDNLTQRNPFSWYGYAYGSRANDWGLAQNEWTPVTGIVLQPSMWHGHYGHHGAGVHFILHGAKDSRQPNSALFPEFLKKEFHEVRSVIEAHSKASKMSGADESSACGYHISSKGDFSLRVRVTDATGNVADYTIDRWE